jgi:hypothetical protein
MTKKKTIRTKLFKFEFEINYELNKIDDLLREMYAVYKSERGKEMKYNVYFAITYHNLKYGDHAEARD